VNEQPNDAVHDTAAMAAVPLDEQLDTDGDPFLEAASRSHAVSPFTVENEIVRSAVEAWYDEPGDVVDESLG
jgi:hypothetical protein